MGVEVFIHLIRALYFSLSFLLASDCLVGIVEAPTLLLNIEGEEALGKEGGLGQLWHRLDSSFRQPRAYVRAVLATPVVKDRGAEAMESANIMTDILHKVRLVF